MKRRKRYIVLFFIPALVLLFTIEGCGNGKRETPSVSQFEKDGWEITLTTNQQRYLWPFDTATVTLEVKNISDQERRLPDTGIDISLGTGRISKVPNPEFRQQHSGHREYIAVDYVPRNDGNLINFSEAWNWSHNHRVDTDVLLVPGQSIEVARLNWKMDTWIPGGGGFGNMAVGFFDSYVIAAEYEVKTAFH